MWAIYRIHGPMLSSGVHSRNVRNLTIRKATYNAATRTVTLVLRSPLGLRSVYQLIVSAGASGGLTSTTGVPLAGQAGQPGTSYTAYLNRYGLSTSSVKAKPAKPPSKVTPAKPAAKRK